MKKILIGGLFIICSPIIGLFVYGMIIGFIYHDIPNEELLQKYFIKPLERLRNF